MQFLKRYDLLKLRKHFSFSFIKELSQCGMRALFGRILNIPKPMWKLNAARLKGIAVHKILELFFEKSKTVDLYKDLDRALDIIFVQAESDINDEEDRPEEEKTYIRDYIRLNNLYLKGLLTPYLKGFRKDIEIYRDFLLPELSFKKTEIAGHLCTGRIDLGIGPRLVDFKTTSKSNTGPMLQHVYKLQCGMYDLMDELSEKPAHFEHFSVHQIILKKQPEVLEFDFTKEEINTCKPELKHNILQARKLISDQTFVRNYADIFCPCEYIELCRDEKKVEQAVKDLELPESVF